MQNLNVALEQLHSHCPQLAQVEEGRVYELSRILNGLEIQDPSVLNPRIRSLSERDSESYYLRTKERQDYKKLHNIGITKKERK